MFAILIAGIAVCGGSLSAAPGVLPDFAADETVSWIPVGDDYLPPANGPGPVTFDKAHPYVPNFTPGKAPTYRVSDIRNPILQPWAAERMKKTNDEVLAGKVPFRARESCWPTGVPTFLVYALATPLYFFQTPKMVVLAYQGGEYRHVYLDVPHSQKVTPSWYGESVGRYEGDTLVVDTIGLSERTFVDNYRTPHTTALHVIERYRLIDDGKTLEINFRVEDKGAFTTPWSAVQRFRISHRTPMIEAPCAETDVRYFAYDQYPVPSATKPDF